MDKESRVDNLRQSLVFVRGVETQALFNFLINCKSATSVTGALAGIPPTLLAPTAFHGATLKPLKVIHELAECNFVLCSLAGSRNCFSFCLAKVRESVVRLCDDNNRYYSLELKGPLLPHVLPSLCHLMKSSQLEQYSASCAQLASTSSFSAVKYGK